MAAPPAGRGHERQACSPVRFWLPKDRSQAWLCCQPRHAPAGTAPQQHNSRTVELAVAAALGLDVCRLPPELLGTGLQLGQVAGEGVQVARGRLQLSAQVAQAVGGVYEGPVVVDRGVLELPPQLLLVRLQSRRRQGACPDVGAACWWWVQQGAHAHFMLTDCTDTHPQQLRLLGQPLQRVRQQLAEILVRHGGIYAFHRGWLAVAGQLARDACRGGSAGGVGGPGWRAVAPSQVGALLPGQHGRLREIAHACQGARDASRYSTTA